MMPIMIEISAEEAQLFLAHNQQPSRLDEAYIWLAVSTAEGGVVLLEKDDLRLAAAMARQAKLEALVGRLELRQ